MSQAERTRYFAWSVTRSIRAKYRVRPAWHIKKAPVMQAIVLYSQGEGDMGGP